MTALKSTQQVNSSLPVYFKIKVIGYIDKRSADYFGDFSITHKRINNNQKVSCLTGEVSDQAALIGVLNLLYDMRFPIISVKTLKRRGKSSKRKNIKL
jgi:hypothetical protein